MERGCDRGEIAEPVIPRDDLEERKDVRDVGERGEKRIEGLFLLFEGEGIGA